MSPTEGARKGLSQQRPRAFQYIRPDPSQAPLLSVVVDVDGRGQAAKALGDVHSALRRQGVVPTYAVGARALESPACVDLLRSIFSSKQGEIALLAMPGESDAQALAALMRRLEHAFGTRPRSFRSPGGITELTADTLAALGLEYDLSTHVSRLTPTRGVAEIYPMPFLCGPNGQVRALPASTAFIDPLRSADWAGERSGGRLGLLRRVAISPERMSANDAVKALSSLVKRGRRHFCICTGVGDATASIAPDVWLERVIAAFRTALSGALVTPHEIFERSLMRADPSTRSKLTVSVVIPTFNRAGILRRAIDSVVAQTRAADEIIIVDDGSTDDTRTVVESYGARVRYVPQHNAGVGAARNTGIKAATSHTVAFLDSDDLWAPEKLALQMEVLESYSDVALAYCDMSVMDDDGREMAPSYVERHMPSYDAFDGRGLFDRWCEVSSGGMANAVLIGDLSSAMFVGNFMPFPSVVARRDDLLAVGGFDPAIGNTGEDYDLLSRLARRGKVALLCGSHGRVRRGGKDHLYEQSARMAHSNWATMEKLAGSGQRLDLPPFVIRQRWRDAHAWVGFMNFSQGDMAGARKHFLASMRLRRADPHMVGHLLLTFVGKRAREALLSSFQRSKRLFGSKAAT